MEFSLLIFLTFIFSFSRAEWNMSDPIYRLTGESFHLLYTTTDDIDICVFYLPSVNRSLDRIDIVLGNHTTGTSEKRPSEWTWNWYGEDSKKDCGIQINNASMADRGLWQVHTLSNKLLQEDIKYVSIFEHIAPDSISLNKKTLGTYTIKPGDRPILVKIICTAYKTRGKVTFTWWIGDNQLSGNVTDYPITNNTDYPDEQYKDVSQMLKYNPVPSHDGKQLKCMANHSEYSKEDLANKTNIAAVNITVKAPPVPQENDIVFKKLPLGNQSIDIPFHANPSPSYISWKMHDMDHPLREDEQATGRYKSLGWNKIANGVYIATIRVSNLTESDGGHPNLLMVKNEIGNTSYTFTFDFEEADIVKAGLSVGEIAGIVLGCLGAVCLTWLVVSQVRKRRKSKNITQEGGAENREEMRETPRTQREED